MPVLTKINSNVIADDAITGDMLGSSAYLANTANQNISGTYSENRLYTSDAYTLSGNATINSHLTLSTIKDSGNVVLTADGARTITGTGTLSGGSLFAPQRVTLTGMTGELGSAVTGSPNLNLTSGSIGSGVTSDPKGVAVVDYWRVASSHANTGYNVVTENWERVDSAYGGGDLYSFTVGGGLVCDNGVFSFTETGIYLIMTNVYVYGTNGQNYVGLDISVTENNGGSWVVGGITYDGTPHGSSHHAALYVRHIFNCSNISTHKFRIRADSPSATNFYGTTAVSQFGLSVEKLN